MLETLLVVVIGLLCVAAIDDITGGNGVLQVAARIRRAWRGLLR